ncbi:uncharacterized protein LOC111623778 [Centruroides sculpturatus]|uniref:uncharacterized protein LOC111623778 n=1 Tax=Centruroides sculpturatus TaxID=218467 RepID=UPI000C6EC781|nr:uncharacterized protein LOC111623778 [Centruroides sculpturatus]
MENLETLTSKISKFGTISSRSDTHTTSSLEETRISELSNCEITDLIETKVSRNEFLTRENILLEIHLHRIGKDDLKEERKSIRKSRPSSIMLKRRNTYFDMSLLKPPDAETSSFHDRSSEALVMKQKYYILKTEMKLKNDEIKNRAEQHESTLWDIHMELEELEERYKEVEKRKRYFEFYIKNKAYNKALAVYKAEFIEHLFKQIIKNHLNMLQNIKMNTNICTVAQKKILLKIEYVDSLIGENYKREDAVKFKCQAKHQTSIIRNQQEILQIFRNKMKNAKHLLEKLRNEIEEIECRLEIISDTIKWKTTINERISENITQQEKEIEAYQKEYDYIKNMVSSYKPITIIDVIKQQKTLKMTQNQLKYFKRKTNLLDLKLGKFA